MFMARNYDILIIDHFNKLAEALSKRKIVAKEDLLKAINDEWEFEKAFTSTIAYIGELSGKLDNDLKTTHNEIDWTALKAVRNTVAHDYEAVNFRRLINIYYNQILPLVELLRK